MKTPRQITTILVIAALLTASALFSFLAVIAPLGDPASAGLRPWNVKFVIALVALGFFGFALMVFVRALGRRSDEEFARSLAAKVTVAVYIYPRTLEQIGAAFPGKVSHLPSRAVLAADETGLTLWARPAVRCISIPWSAISNVRPAEVGNRRWDGLAIRLVRDQRQIEMVLVGTRFLGRPSREQAIEVASQLSAVREGSH